MPSLDQRRAFNLIDFVDTMLVPVKAVRFRMNRQFSRRVNWSASSGSTSGRGKASFPLTKRNRPLRTTTIRCFTTRQVSCTTTQTFSRPICNSALREQWVGSGLRDPLTNLSWDFLYFRRLLLNQQGCSLMSPFST